MFKSRLKFIMVKTVFLAPATPPTSQATFALRPSSAHPTAGPSQHHFHHLEPAPENKPQADAPSPVPLKTLHPHSLTYLPQAFFQAHGHFKPLPGPVHVLFPLQGSLSCISPATHGWPSQLPREASALLPTPSRPFSRLSSVQVSSLPTCVHVWIYC